MEIYLGDGERFEDWLKAKHGLSLDAVINGNSQAASNLVSEYLNGWLASSEVGYRRSVLKHLCAMFRLCGRPLLDVPLMRE